MQLENNSTVSHRVEKRLMDNTTGTCKSTYQLSDMMDYQSPAFTLSPSKISATLL